MTQSPGRNSPSSSSKTQDPDGSANGSAPPTASAQAEMAQGRKREVLLRNDAILVELGQIRSSLESLLSPSHLNHSVWNASSAGSRAPSNLLGEQQAAAIEANLTSLESKLDALLASIEGGSNGSAASQGKGAGAGDDQGSAAKKG
ncbi:hypothetical protein F4778DRAFT_781417 [Xylariomycetidae sp. FL2044]|nr:hypothetical protein F4778DRAFT_781417 [Xylariomycetidae sp. FL2044]